MDFASALNICRASKLMFARPISWRSWRKAHGIDLGGKLSALGVVQEVYVGQGEGLYCVVFSVTTDELVEDWVLVSKLGLVREYLEVKETLARRGTA